MLTDHRDRPGAKRSDRVPNSRHQDECDWLYGRNAVLEGLSGRRSLHRLRIFRTAKRDTRLDEIVRRADALDLAIDRVDRDLLDRVAPGVNHQGVALQASRYRFVSTETFVREPGPILALDHLVDPQNLGTLFRAAEAFNIAGVLLPKDRAAGVTPAVVNSSAGAVEHLKIAQVTNLANELDLLKVLGWWVIGLENRPGAEQLGEARIPEPCVLIVGAEGQGIGKNVLRRCDLLLKIEMTGKVNSLNAATAGAIALFAIRNWQNDSS